MRLRVRNRAERVLRANHRRAMRNWRQQGKARKRNKHKSDQQHRKELIAELRPAIKALVRVLDTGGWRNAARINRTRHGRHIFAYRTGVQYYYPEGGTTYPLMLATNRKLYAHDNYASYKWQPLWALETWILEELHKEIVPAIDKAKASSQTA